MTSNSICLIIWLWWKFRNNSFWQLQATSHCQYFARRSRSYPMCHHGVCAVCCRTFGKSWCTSMERRKSGRLEATIEKLLFRDSEFADLSTCVFSFAEYCHQIHTISTRVFWSCTWRHSNDHCSIRSYYLQKELSSVGRIGCLYRNLFQ